MLIARAMGTDSAGGSASCAREPPGVWLSLEGDDKMIGDGGQDFN